MYEYEYETALEALPEFELEDEFEAGNELELETLGELEGEYESEQFFQQLAALGARGIRAAVNSPVIRDLGLRAGRAVLQQGLPAIGGAIGKQYGARWGQLGRDAGTLVGNLASSWLPDKEFASEYELETPLNRPIASAALMEHLGHASTVARTEPEAEAFIGAIVPLAARLSPRVAPVVMAAAPGLIRGIAAVVRRLRANPSTRHLVRVVPTILQRTVQSLAQRAANGGSVTPQIALATLARMTSRVLGNPQNSVAAWQRSRALDRQYHRLAGAARFSPPLGPTGFRGAASRYPAQRRPCRQCGRP